MKIPPDKIYIPIIEEDGKKLLCTNWWDVDTSPQNAYVNETIPYIRKDALLEWANSWLAFKRSGVVLDDGFSYAMEELIKKLNEM